MTALERKLIKALDEISNYILPVFTIENKQYVPVANALFLRDLATEAIAKISNRPVDTRS